MSDLIRFNPDGHPKLAPEDANIWERRKSWVVGGAAYFVRRYEYTGADYASFLRRMRAYPRGIKS